MTPETCVAWILSGEKQCIGKLIGGFWPNTARNRIEVHMYFTKAEFVLYDDLFDPEKNLLHDDTLMIVFEVQAFTSLTRRVFSATLCPAYPVLSRVKVQIKINKGPLLST